MSRCFAVNLLAMIAITGFVHGQDSGSSATSRAGSPVLLGGDDLTGGIPGDGPLSTEEIRRWLDSPAQHEPLTVQLPTGLAVGQSAIFIPQDNPLTRAKIELGRQLYFDTRLSSDGTVSCASCHHPETGYSRPTQFGVGIGNQTGNRNSPVSYNRILSRAQFWDGRAASLEDQAVGPIANPIEMGFTHDACVERLKGVEGYRLQFERIFPQEKLTIQAVGKAIAAFERAIVTGPSPADYYEPLRTFTMQFRDDLADLKTFEKEDPDSYALYMKLKKASDAHRMNESANFADELYHNLGVGMDRSPPDLGRYEQTKQDKDRGAFKTPTIRNVALTAPYMHDGSLKTLEEVVEWYDKGGHPNSYLSDKVKKLNLTPQEKSDLVEYMKSLTGPFPKVRQDRLPR
jgi:cytochrome c peroxidase